MLRGSIPLGHLFGIRFAVSPSWLIIFALVWASLALGYLPLHYPRLPSVVHWLAGLAACLLFFLCVLLHELAHSLLALKKGLPVRGITLFMLGGVSNIGREAPSPA